MDDRLYRKVILQTKSRELKNHGKYNKLIIGTNYYITYSLEGSEEEDEEIKKEMK